jgi:hypothetical protein
MRTLARYASSIGTAAALLAGCGGLQPRIGVQGVMPQSRAIVHGAGRNRAAAPWIGATTSSQKLLYVSSEGGTVYVYSYPQGKFVNTLKPLNTYAAGECVDSAGDVFVTTSNSSGSSTIYEYAHGGTNPINALSDPGVAGGCAVDRTTGNLAVTNPRDFNNPYYAYTGDLAVYAGAQGQPTMYYPKPPLAGFIFGTYDDRGNLYLSAGDNSHPDYVDLVRLSSGSSSFEMISLPEKFYGPASVQWDGKYVTFSSGGDHDPLLVYRLHISGSNAKLIATTQLTSQKNLSKGQAWIRGHTIIGTDYIRHGYQDVSFWAYPKGGKPEHNINKAGVRGYQLWGVAVSVAPSQ